MVVSHRPVLPISYRLYLIYVQLGTGGAARLYLSYQIWAPLKFVWSVGCESYLESNKQVREAKLIHTTIS